MTAWVIRAGKVGEKEQWCLDSGYAGGDWSEVGDLSACHGREDIKELLRSAMPDAGAGRINNHAAQLWGLRRIAIGDLIVLPLKMTKALAIGVCTESYQFLKGQPLRHVIKVDWRRTDIPRSAIKDDLLYTLGAFLTIFSPSRNNAEERLQRVLETGIDPGSLGLRHTPKSAGAPSDGEEFDDDVADPIIEPTLEVIRDRVRTFISENFKGHALTTIVEAILQARNFICDVSPAGPDQGVDILAGSGSLGLDSPTLVVEVKSEEGQVSAPVVRGLQGAMHSNKADQALLVAWGGITRDARREIRTDRLTMRVWDAEDLLDQLFEVYDLLEPDLKRQIPLKRAWVLDDEAG